MLGGDKVKDIILEGFSFFFFASLHEYVFVRIARAAEQSLKTINK